MPNKLGHESETPTDLNPSEIEIFEHHQINRRIVPLEVKDAGASPDFTLKLLRQALYSASIFKYSPC